MKIVQYKWICTNSEKVEEVDSQLKEAQDHQVHLSKYRNENTISGLECLSIDRRLTDVIRALKVERSSLWRRIKVETEMEGEDVHMD